MQHGFAAHWRHMACRWHLLVYGVLRRAAIVSYLNVPSVSYGLAEGEKKRNNKKERRKDR